MSRLDFITIIIVVVCLAAIIFLIYKMTDLFEGKNKKPDAIEYPIDSTSMEDDSMYPSGLDSTNAANSGFPDSLSEDYDDDYSFSDTKEEATEQSNEGNLPGKYLVIAGSFEYRDNADNFAKKLRKMGYEKAVSKIFDRGKYAVVVAARFDDVESAKQLAAELNDKLQIEAFVQEARKKVAN